MATRANIGWTIDNQIRTNGVKVGDIRTVEHEFNNAEVLTAYSANSNKGLELVPAPGSGKMIEYISGVFVLNYVTAAFVHTYTCTVNIGTNDIGSIVRDFLQATEDYLCYRTYDYDLVTLATYMNQAVYFHAKTANPTTGGGTISARISYRILDFN